jgi:hypothetical protein
MSHLSLPRVRRVAMIALGVAITALLVAVFYANRESAQSATNLPADKVTVTGAKPDIVDAGSNVTLLGPVQMRTSTPEDLVFHVTAECSILNHITNTGNSSASSEGQVRVWVEFDGKAVPVVPGPAGSGGPADDGKVVFCNRTYSRTTAGFTESETISDYLNTREANAFNWASLDSGNGIHTIAVKGEFTKTATNGTASAIIGNRTLVVDPTKVQNQ